MTGFETNVSTEVVSSSLAPRRVPRLLPWLMVAWTASVASAQSVYQWKVDADGNWNDPANWSLVSGPAGAGFPNGTADEARFVNALTADRTVTIPSGLSATIAALDIDDNDVLTIASLGTGTLRLATGGSPAVIGIGNTVGDGAHVLAAALLIESDVHVVNRSAATLTIAGDVSLGTRRTLDIDDGASPLDMDIAGAVVDGGVIKSGAGTLRFSGSASNSYLDGTTVLSGTLELAKNNGGENTAVAIPTGLVIGDRLGGADADVVVQLVSHQFAPLANLTIASSGLLNVNSRVETIGNLRIDGGRVRTGATGQLTIAGLELTGGWMTAEGVGARFVLAGDVRAQTSEARIDGPGMLVLAPGAHSFVMDVQIGHAGPVAQLEVLTSIGGSGGISSSGVGTLRLSGNNTYTGGTRVVTGSLEINGTQSPGEQLIVDGILRGKGTLRALYVHGGRVEPGVTAVVRPQVTSPGTLKSGDAVFTAGSDFVVDITPTTAARLNVSGTIDITGADLSLVQVGRFVLGPAAFDTTVVADTTFVIIDNDGTDPVVGQFSGIPEGGINNFGQRFVVSYVGGDGNDVTIRALPAPSSNDYQLAEGATGDFFDTDILLANPNIVAAPVTMTFQREQGDRVVYTTTVAPQSRKTVHVDDIPGLGSTSAGVNVHSDANLTLAVERTMFWGNGQAYGGHTSRAVPTNQNWWFGEGAQGFFDTFFLISNPTVNEVELTFNFLREGDTPFAVTRSLAPYARLTVYAGEFPQLVNRGFGAFVFASNFVVVERAMYFGNTAAQLWTGGHVSHGVNDFSTHWFLAEGATGDFFDTFILLSNPNSSPANVTLRFLLETGDNVTVSRIVPPLQRVTVNPEAESDSRLRHGALSTVVTSDVAIVAERSMYWPAGDAFPWGEGHNETGVTGTSSHWTLAEGRIGGPNDFSTYILLANPEPTTANVTITYLRESGAAVTRTHTVPGTSRVTVDVRGDVPELQDERLGADVVVTSGPGIVVERSMYWNAGGVFWAGGTIAAGTRMP